MKSRAIQKNDHDRWAAGPLLNRLRTVLEGGQRVLVASHIDPDGDALGTQLAFGAYLRSLGKETILVRQGELPSKYRFLPGIERVIPLSDVGRQPDADTALVLECPTIARLGEAARLLRDGISVVNIDHHVDNARFGDVSWVDSEASSVGEMAYEYFCSVGYEITADDAVNLYTAVLTDTGRFRYSSTTPRTMMVAGKFLEAGADSQKICDQVYYSMSRATMRLIGRVLSGIEFHHDGRVCLLTLTLRMLEETGADAVNSEGLVDHTLFCEGVVLGALLKEVAAGKSTKVSFRSRGGINVAAIATEFGGGGHCNASGGTVPSGIAEAKKILINRLGEALDAAGK